ncbi:MAG: DUF2752 domain-containing protein [Planctomycetota bacterium]
MLRAPTPRLVLRCVTAAAIALILAAVIAHRGTGADLVSYLPKHTLCPFRAITGLRCPGCGMTRAMLSLAQGQVARAAGFNPLCFPLLAVIVVYAALGRVPLWRSPWCERVALAGVLAFWVARLVT